MLKLYGRFIAFYYRLPDRFLKLRIIGLLNNELHRIKWWDQDLLNIIFEKHWLSLDLKWNAQSYLFDGIKNATEGIKPKYESLNYIEATTNPAVVHFARGDKPWMRNCKIAIC
ncbi:glycosyltransferase [Mucilaginibacter sp.]|uniref:glycosyltransferase n=1 Tax=Mucilaginibacter sp. TaxID=1882438 RepID=UPI00262A8673|nr:glycosyltransferase [Mucilaginibacter sp.]MDB4927020.1 glycosyl transferase family 8 [Mucilaginibacter sp.]